MTLARGRARTNLALAPNHRAREYGILESMRKRGER
jgi:hypothetical protein